MMDSRFRPGDGSLDVVLPNGRCCHSDQHLAPRGRLGLISVVLVWALGILACESCHLPMDGTRQEPNVASPSAPPATPTSIAKAEVASSPSPVPTPEPTASLRITNDSGVDIWYVYLAPSFSDQWGADLLGGSVIADGASLTLSGIPAGIYDVKAETSHHMGIDVFYEKVFDGLETWEVRGGDGRFMPRLDQWAYTATASSELSNPGWSAEQASGEPDTPDCGHFTTAWASSAPDRVEWLEPGFPLPVVSRRINVYETHSPGFIVRVEVIDKTHQYHTVWEGDPAPCRYVLASCLSW